MNRRQGSLKSMGCGIVVFLSLLLVPAIAWLLVYFVFSPSLWKTEVSRVKMPNGHILSIGRAHDGDISYQYYARVRGSENDKLGNWVYLDWCIDKVDEANTAVTSDSRFAAAEFKIRDGRILVIYDSKDSEIWWNTRGSRESTTKFLRAWRQLHSENPKLTEPP